MPNALTAAAKSFVTGEPSKPTKRKGKSSMRDSLRGSARVDTVGEREAASNGAINTSNVSKAWQAQAWAFYDSVGETRYASGFVGACLSRCTLTVGLPDGKGHIGPVFDENGDPLKDENGVVLPGLERAHEALALVQALKSDVAGQSQLLRTMGINITVAGEFHLVGSGPTQQENPFDMTPAPQSITQWEVLSTREFVSQGEDYVRYPTQGATPQAVPGESVHVVRIWRSHPCWSNLPDSSLRAVEDILVELQLLTQEVRGETLSRISNGKVLLVPEEIEFPDDDADDSTGEGGDSFTRDLVEQLATPITDKGSAAGIAPFVIRGPAEFLKEIRTLDLSRSNPSDSSAKRTEAVQRFAQGIDLPVEIVSGHSGSTFANAVVIDDSTYKVHIEPLLEIIADGLTSGYLRPALGGASPLVVFYDTSELVSRPNRSADAKDLHDRYALSDASLRTSSGFSDSDAPDEEELDRRIKLKQALQVRQTVQATPDGMAAEDASASDVNGAELPGSGDALVPSGTSPTPGGPITQGDSSAATTDGPLTASAHEAEVAAAVRAATLKALAHGAVERAVERVGARLRTKTTKNMGIRAVVDETPNAEVAATIGPAEVKALIGKEDLLKAEFDVLHHLVLIETNGDRAFADKMRSAAIAVTETRMYSPKEPFPFQDLPTFHG